MRFGALAASFSLSLGRAEGRRMDYARSIIHPTGANLDMMRFGNFPHALEDLRRKFKKVGSRSKKPAYHAIKRSEQLNAQARSNLIEPFFTYVFRSTRGLRPTSRTGAMDSIHLMITGAARRDLRQVRREARPERAGAEGAHGDRPDSAAAPSWTRGVIAAGRIRCQSRDALLGGIGRESAAYTAVKSAFRARSQRNRRPSAVCETIGLVTLPARKQAITQCPPIPSLRARGSGGRRRGPFGSLLPACGNPPATWRPRRRETRWIPPA